MKAYWIDEFQLESHLDCSLEELERTGVLTGMEQAAPNERRLLVLLRTGDEAQRLRALEQLKKLYISR